MSEQVEFKPMFPIFFRRASMMLTVFQPLAVDLSVRAYDYVATPPTVLLHIKIYEKRTGKGVPKAPFTIYSNDEKIYTGTTDVNGEAEYLMTFKDLGRYTIDVYLLRMELGRAHSTLTITVFKGHLYDDGACWWMLGMRSMVWFSDRKPAPSYYVWDNGWKNPMIWFSTAVFTGPGVARAWENKTDILCHVDMILTSPSGKVYNLNVSGNDVTLAPNSGRFMHTCVCLLQPIERLNERGTWKLNVVFRGSSNTTRSILLDEKEVTFTVT